MKNYKYNRTLLIVLLVVSLLAAEFSAASIPALANEQPSIGFSGNEQPEGFYVTMCGYHFDDIANLTLRITYDPAVLRYVSYEANPVLNSALVSVSASNGVLTLAFISTSDLSFTSCDLITFCFELLNPKPTYTEIHSTLVECTDSIANAQTVSCEEYVGFWVKNDATTSYNLYVSSSSDVPLYADVPVQLVFSENKGFFAGSLTLTYDPAQLEFAGCNIVQTGGDMVVHYTDLGNKTTGKVKIAFAGTQLYTDVGSFLEIILVPKVTGWCWYDVSELVLTNENLQDVHFDSGYSSSFYATDISADNYFSISSETEIDPGDTLDIVIDLNNNAGFAALTGALLYDSSIFEFVQAEFASDIVANAFSSVSGATSGEVRFGVVSTSLLTNSGNLLTITLRALEGSNEATNLELKIIELVDTVGIPLTYATDIGTVSVGREHIHTWEETYVVLPTCTEQGYTLYTCSECGSTREDNVVEAYGHSFTYYDGQTPGCTYPGWEPYAICNICGYSTFIELPPTDHNYEITVIEPTCYDQGYSIYTCVNCWYSYTDNYVDTNGHTPADPVVENEYPASCTNEGFYDSVVYCTDCGWELSRETIWVPATEHDYQSTVVPPTCTGEGYTSYTCTHCASSYLDDFISPKGHTSADPVVENEYPASCTNDGFYDSVVYCTDCGWELSRETIWVPATEHDYQSTVVPPTCTEQGYTIYTCSCGNSYADNYVVATGHTYVEGICMYCGEDEPTGLLGDVNSDGRVNARDARALLRYIAGLIGEDELNPAVADYNGDGRINARDARVLLRHIAGLD